MAVEIEKQNALLQLELCKLQMNHFYLQKRRIMLFRKTQPGKKYPLFYDI